jgi:aminoglycoside phosphotransferase (APT) family kinase protein
VGPDRVGPDPVGPDPAPVRTELDLAALTAHLRRSGFPAAGPLTAELITTGRSNLTYLVSDRQSRWILRRPPLGHVLATAHDMRREYVVLSALAGTAVPVPRALHGFFKLAVIAQTIVDRHRQGAAVGERLSEVAGAVSELIAAGLRAFSGAQARA